MAWLRDGFCDGIRIDCKHQTEQNIVMGSCTLKLEVRRKCCMNYQVEDVESYIYRWFFNYLVFSCNSVYTYHVQVFPQEELKRYCIFLCFAKGVMRSDTIVVHDMSVLSLIRYTHSHTVYVYVPVTFTTYTGKSIPRF